MKRATLAVLAALLLVGCSTFTGDDEDDGSVTDEASIRAMAADEILGELGYGETKDVDLTPAPKYRAFWFQAERGDQIQAQVVTLDATDPVLWLTDEDFNVVAMSNDVRATDTNAAIQARFLPKSGKYYLVFREMYFAPRAKFAVSVRKLGVLPLDCDPDGEGIFSSDCTEPLDVDPFDVASCEGADLTASEATAKFGATGGLRLSGAKIYYRTRQCSEASGVPQCSPWVRAYAMDTRFATIAATQPPAGAPASASPSTWTMAAEGSRKSKVEWSLEPTTTKQFCVDGPFTSLRGADWSAFADGTPGVCGTGVAAKVTPNCARFEAKPIQLGSGSPSYYTELSPVLLARY